MITAGPTPIQVCDTESERQSSWPDGLLMYCKDTNKLYCMEGGAFVLIGPSAAGPGSLTTGTATLDFGAFQAAAMKDMASHPKTHAEIAVTGQTGIVAGSLVQAWIRAEPAGTATHSMDEHLNETLRIVAGNIAAGTGFTIYAECLVGGTYGTFTVNWLWN